MGFQLYLFFFLFFFFPSNLGFPLVNWLVKRFLLHVRLALCDSFHSWVIELDNRAQYPTRAYL